MTAATDPVRVVAEVYLRRWFDTRPGMTGEREEARLKFINGVLPVGTRLVPESLLAEAEESIRTWDLVAQAVRDAWSNVWQWSDDMTPELQQDLIELRSVMEAALTAQPAPVVGGGELWSYERRHVANE